MQSEDDLPSSPYERALALQGLVISFATGGSPDHAGYQQLRKEFVENPVTKDLLPRFVRANRTLEAFWAWVKVEAQTYAERRAIIHAGFAELLDHLEGAHRAPQDSDVSEALRSFDPDGVHAAWSKALERRKSDPEGAITSARTLLETVCKRILEENEETYSEKDDLPKLYHSAAQKLNLAPSQHTEEVFKSILGGCQNIINSLGTLRNKIGDAHGKGKMPVRPSQRHAALAVNLAGAMAMYLVETHLERRGGGMAATQRATLRGNER